MGSSPFGGLVKLRSVWSKPSDVLTIVMIIGGDIVQRSIAQLSGSLYTPVPFSFGWVAYSFSSLVSSFGENKLMPESDCTCIAINARGGHVRDVRSWILGRVVRDFHFWKPKVVGETVEGLLDEATKRDLERARKNAGTEEGVSVPRRVRAGLCISIFNTSPSPSPSHHSGTPSKDWVYYSGLLTTLIQLLISALPWILFADWLIFLVAASGTLLAALSCSLPQWRAEKWNARRQAKDIALTRGNGAQHVIIIRGGVDTLDLEDLASGAEHEVRGTRFFTAVMAFMWLVLLICVTAIDDNPWFLIAVGALGMVQNVIAAGAPRQPSAFGIHLDISGVEVVSGVKVMDALMALEEKYEGMGASLVETFFPGGLKGREEIEFWERKKRERGERKRRDRHTSPPDVYQSGNTS